MIWKNNIFRCDEGEAQREENREVLGKWNLKKISWEQMLLKIKTNEIRLKLTNDWIIFFVGSSKGLTVAIKKNK